MESENLCLLIWFFVSDGQKTDSPKSVAIIGMIKQFEPIHEILVL